MKRRSRGSRPSMSRMATTEPPVSIADALPLFTE